MLGRFLSYAYLVSVTLVVLKINKNLFLKFKKNYYSWIIIALYLLVYPHTPFNSAIDYNYRKFYLGVSDERGCYFKYNSLYRYVLDKDKENYFPLFIWAKKGLYSRKNPKKVIAFPNIGIFGYWAGAKKIIVDEYALSDPLLARMHIPKRPWRIGHFSRVIPKGYLKSIRKNKSLIANKNINEYYKKIKIITQDKELFTKERIKTIILMNLGVYNYLLK